MLLTRWIKNRHYMNDNVRKYLGYAAGEIVLVIVGILMFEEACSFSARTVTYLEPGER